MTECGLMTVLYLYHRTPLPLICHSSESRLTLALVTWWIANQLLNNLKISLLFLGEVGRIKVIPSLVLTDLCNRSWKDCLLEEPAPKPSSQNLPSMTTWKHPAELTICKDSGSRKTYTQLHTSQISLVALTSYPQSPPLLPFPSETRANTGGEQRRDLAFIVEWSFD
jgi:hypothetical protein